MQELIASDEDENGDGTELRYSVCRRYEWRDTLGGRLLPNNRKQRAPVVAASA